LPGWPGTPLPFKAYGVRSDLELGVGAKAIAHFSDGTAAVTSKQVGAKGGRAVHFAWLPGVSYWFSNTSETHDLSGPHSDENIRTIIAGLALAAHIRPPVTVSEPRIETPLLVSPNSSEAVVTLLNFKLGGSLAAPTPPCTQLAVNVSTPMAPSSVHSVELGALEFQLDSHSRTVAFTVPRLDHADFVLLTEGRHWESEMHGSKSL
jgi:hypothetical protein